MAVGLDWLSLTVTCTGWTGHWVGVSVVLLLPSGPTPGNCDGLEVVTALMARQREKKTGRLRTSITLSSVRALPP